MSKFIVREARRRKGLSVPKIAEHLGVSTTAVWNWDRGKSHPRPDAAERLASLLGIDSALILAPAERPFADGQDDSYLTCGEILDDAKARLARKLGLPESAFEISINITR
jgi:ribosome-binding protein aMBF1 (putative translation factor)